MGFLGNALEKVKQRNPEKYNEIMKRVSDYQAEQKRQEEAVVQRGQQIVESGQKPHGFFNRAAVALYKRKLGQ